MNRMIAVVGLIGGAAALVSCANDPAADPPVTCGPPTDEPPDNLACTGLYADQRTSAVAVAARPYAPATSFWSDGYDKSRFIALPDGAPIDVASIDDWVFPVGTKVWKEFRFKERKIETRLLWKVSADRWVQAAYVWSDDGKTATRGEGASLSVAGEPYKVPTSIECNECHLGKKDKLLGFEALSLAQPAATGVTMTVLAAESRLVPAPPRTTLSIDPGLAVLHVNCGVSCHNAAPAAAGNESTLRLRVGFDEAASKPVETWEAFASSVGVRTTLPGWNGALRVDPGAPDKSVLVTAMTTRGTGQMPPNTRTVDFDGVAAVESWVRALPVK